MKTLTNLIWLLLRPWRMLLPSSEQDGFPKRIENLWYMGMWYKMQYLQYFEMENTVHFDPFKSGLVTASDTSNLIAGLIPAVRIGHTVGLYAVESKGYADHHNGDRALWDDGRTVTLVLKEFISVYDAEEKLFCTKRRCFN